MVQVRLCHLPSAVWNDVNTMRTYLLRHQPPMRRDGQPAGGAAAVLPDAAPA